MQIALCTSEFVRMYKWTKSYGLVCFSLTSCMFWKMQPDVQIVWLQFDIDLTCDLDLMNPFSKFSFDFHLLEKFLQSADILISGRVWYQHYFFSVWPCHDLWPLVKGHWKVNPKFHQDGIHILECILEVIYRGRLKLRWMMNHYVKIL